MRLRAGATLALFVPQDGHRAVLLAVLVLVHPMPQMLSQEQNREGARRENSVRCLHRKRYLGTHTLRWRSTQTATSPFVRLHLQEFQEFFVGQTQSAYTVQYNFESSKKHHHKPAQLWFMPKAEPHEKSIPRDSSVQAVDLVR